MLYASFTMERDKALLTIRESLELPADTSEKSELITFQNKALRPILKFQNDLLVSTFKNYITDRKMKWETSDTHTKNRFINASLSNDIKLKSALTGMVIGLLTSEELALYLINQREINRRITAMCKERLFDQLVK